MREMTFEERAKELVMNLVQAISNKTPGAIVTDKELAQPIADELRAVQVAALERAYTDGFWESWRAQHSECVIKGPMENAAGWAYHCNTCRQLKVLLRTVLTDALRRLAAGEAGQ